MLISSADTLSIGASVALLLLGIVVWVRNARAFGNVVFGLLAASLAYWTAIDWLLGLPWLPPAARTGAKILFYFTICFGPAIAAHAAAYLARRRFFRTSLFFYGAGALSFLFLTVGLLAKTFPIPFDPEPMLTGGAFLALLATTASLLGIAVELYPVLFAHTASVLNRRRAAYGLLLLVPFLLAGGFGLVIGPIPSGVALPLLALLFLVFSLLAFLRASFLNVDMSPLEAFYIFLLTFALLLLLGADNREDIAEISLGAAAVGAFGAYAVRTYRGEKRRRVLAEETTEQLRRLDRAKNDFVDMVAHQLRGPLGAIRIAGEMLADGGYGELPEKAKHVAARIEDTATRLLSLSETFLNASRVELGSFVTERVPTDVAAEMKNAIDEMSQFAEEKKIRLTSEFRTPIPPLVRVDRAVLQNALFNLLDNALKYTARGSVTAYCSLERGNLVIDVVDTGAGLTREEIGDLFKKFHRGSAARSRETDGTGLGLYVVRRLVSAAGGTITAESPGKGKGSVFTLRLPVTLTDVSS